jgi:hypothetical protein
MSDERAEQSSEPRVSVDVSVSDDRGHTDTTHATNKDRASNEARPNEAKPDSAARPDNTTGSDSSVSAAKLQQQKRLPALDDDGDVGVQKEHIVTRDGKADLLFTGVLLASAAPASAPKGEWQEYRIYHTTGDKHVFSKVSRHVSDGEEDTHEAEVFDPAPSSTTSQLMRSAREIARARPLTWMDAAVAFFGYDPLAKALYRKLSVRFEEKIS